MRQKQIQNNTLVVVYAMSVVTACAAFWYMSAAVVEQKQQPLQEPLQLSPSPPAAATTQTYTRRKQPPSYSTAALKLGVLALAASSRIASPTTSTFTPTTYTPLASTPAITRANRTVTAPFAHSTYTPTPATTFDTHANRMVTAPLATTYSIPQAPAPAPAPAPVRGVPTHRVTALAMSRRAPVDNNHHPHTSPAHSVASNRFTFGPTIQPADWSKTTEQIFRKFDDYTMYQFVAKYCRQKDYATPEEKHEFIKLHKLTLNRPNIKRESPPS